MIPSGLFFISKHASSRFEPVLEGKECPTEEETI